MKLQYKILWVEDEVDYVGSFPFDRVESHIRDSGFEPALELRSTPEDVRRVVSQNEFDLLIIDFRIADDEFHGSDLIQQIRQNDCLTEVVFYSGSPKNELHKEAGSKGLEGIYFAPKDPDGLVGKIIDVFDLTVRKVLDVNNMRGFVMAGVAELDLLLDEIIQVKHSKISPAHQLALRQKIMQRMVPQAKYLIGLAQDYPEVQTSKLKEALEALQAHEPAQFEILFGRRMDSAKRVDTLVGLCKQHPYLNDHKDDIMKMSTLLEWRNALAHQRPKTTEEGGLEFAVAGTSLPFDAARTLELRREIRKYLDKLTDVLGKVRAFEQKA
jgi:CheY-like chemotaxis protein